MESIINKNENNNSENLSNENIKKNCPFCKNIITLKEYEEHILSHELNQFENRNNINDCGINKNNENNFQIPNFLNYLKTTVNELINTNSNNTNNINIINNRNNNNSNNNISNNNNNNNNISNNNNNNNIRNNNIYINNNSNINRNNINNINNNNNIIINSDDDDNDYNSDSESNLDKITDKMKPAISKVTDFFKGLFKKNGDSDDSNSSGDEPIINLRIPSLPSLRFISGRRRRSNSLNDLHININNNNNNYNNNNNNNNNDIDDALLDDLLNDEYIKNLSKDDYKEILRYIPTSTVKEVKKNSENNKCIICLSEFQVGEKESTLPCLHIFHSNCIEKWITEKRWCPICKYDISLKSLLSENNI